MSRIKWSPIVFEGADIEGNGQEEDRLATEEAVKKAIEEERYARLVAEIAAAGSVENFLGAPIPSHGPSKGKADDSRMDLTGYIPSGAPKPSFDAVDVSSTESAKINTSNVPAPEEVIARNASPKDVPKLDDRPPATMEGEKQNADKDAICMGRR